MASRIDPKAALRALLPLMLATGAWIVMADARAQAQSPDWEKTISSHEAFNTPITTFLPTDAGPLARDSQTKRYEIDGRRISFDWVRSASALRQQVEALTLFDSLSENGFVIYEMSRVFRDDKCELESPFCVINCRPVKPCVFKEWFYPVISYTAKLYSCAKAREPVDPQQILNSMFAIVPANTSVALPLGLRKSGAITYRNQYKGLLNGTEVRLSSIVFDYSVVPLDNCRIRAPRSEKYVGKATAYEDPADGEWKLQNWQLSDKGEAEFQ